jgi:hypothetical protein
MLSLSSLPREIEMTEPSDLVLSPDEIYAITRYKRPKEQLAALQAMGIPAHLRKIDHTACVLRAHVTNPGGVPAAPSAPGPQLKSIRRLQAKREGAG